MIASGATLVSKNRRGTSSTCCSLHTIHKEVVCSTYVDVHLAHPQALCVPLRRLLRLQRHPRPRTAQVVELEGYGTNQRQNHMKSLFLRTRNTAALASRALSPDLETQVKDLSCLISHPFRKQESLRRSIVVGRRSVRECHNRNACFGTDHLSSHDN